MGSYSRSQETKSLEAALRIKSLFEAGYAFNP